MIKNGNTSNGQGYQISKVQMCLFIYKIEESVNNRPHQVYSEVNSNIKLTLLELIMKKMPT